MWKTVKLADIATVIAGQSPKGEHYNNEGRGTPFYQGKKDYGERYLNEPTVWTDVVTKLAEKDDILISVRAPVGALNIATQKICIGRGLAAIRPSTEILHDYLFYSLLLISHQVEGSAGAIFNSINKAQIEAIEISLPPLAEQQRIVAKLNAAFAKIDEAINAAEAKETEVQKLKTSLLSLSFNGDDLMWKTVKLGEACLVRRGTTITKKQTVEGDVPVIGGGTKPTYFHNEPNRAANCISVSGSGASAGFVNKWEVPIFASDCSTVEPKDGTQIHQFVYYYLMSQQKFIYDNFRSGAAQPHVYAKDIETLDYPIAPIAEQQRIVAKLDAANIEFRNANESIAKSKANYLALKSAILAQELQSSEAA